jgi:predicted nucleic acid-binding protein
MRDRFFLDTNILIYTFDSSAPVKQKQAQKLVHQALTDGNGLISYQVIQEFLNVATKKFSTPLSYIETTLYLEQVLAPLCRFYPNNEFYYFALEIRQHSNFSFYDSLIIAAALNIGCKILYSEDLNHGQEVAGLKIINPF